MEFRGVDAEPQQPPQQAIGMVDQYLKSPNAVGMFPTGMSNWLSLKWKGQTSYKPEQIS